MSEKPVRKDDPENWDKWIKKVESVEFPDVSIELDSAQRVVSVREFVRSHLAVVKANNGSPTFKPYMRRLWQVYQMYKKGLLPEN